MFKSEKKSVYKDFHSYSLAPREEHNLLKKFGSSRNVYNKLSDPFYMEKTIWTPRFYGSCDFGVYLDRDFASVMIQSEVSNERQARMNQLANEELRRLGTNWLNPYTFHENSCFISQFYIGQNGVWLSTNHQTIDGLLNGKEYSEPIVYNSHNVDLQGQAYVLMRLFDQWIEYAETFRRK